MFSREDRYILTKYDLLQKKDIPVKDIQESSESLCQNMQMNIDYYKENYNEFYIELHFLALKLFGDSDLADILIPKSFKMRFRFFNFKTVVSSSLSLDPLTKNSEE